jgi:hypothetical protein
MQIEISNQLKLNLRYAIDAWLDEKSMWEDDIKNFEESGEPIPYEASNSVEYLEALLDGFKAAVRIFGGEILLQEIYKDE